MIRKNFKFEDTDIKILEELKARMNISTDIGAIRYALSLTTKDAVSVYPSLLPLEPQLTTTATATLSPAAIKREAYLNPPKVRKYTDEQVSMYCAKTPFSKGYCPKCSTEFKQMLCGECACLKSPAGIAELMAWLINQYE